MASTSPRPNPAPDELAEATSRRKECDAALRVAYAAGRRAHGDLGIGFDAYADRFVRLAMRRLRAQGIEPTPARVAESVDCAAGEDLHLATACEAGSEGAWRILVERYAPRLAGLAARRGEGRAGAESLAQDVLADMALPPPRGDARTLLGTYDGAGSLFAWLALILVRRIAGGARRKRPSFLDAVEDPDEDFASSSESGRGDGDPAEAVLDREAAAKLGTALDAAWTEMTSQERLALLYRHRDGLSGREMAPLLRVGEPRVSRLVGQAVTKLSTAIRSHLSAASPGEGRGSGAGLWAALRDAVANRMAILPGVVDPPLRGKTPREPGHGS